ncbi:MAG: hypothetical protein V1708_02885 [Candidatus Micrarchaeota archaeon]
MENATMLILIGLLVLGAAGGFFLQEKINSDIGRVSADVALQKQRIDDVSASSDFKFTRLEREVRTPLKMDCTFIEHDPANAGNSACFNEGYPICLFSYVQVNNVYFSSNDGTCASRNFPNMATDFYYRPLNCNASIDGQTNRGYQSGNAVCQTGGYLGSDFWQTGPVKGSYCCRQTSLG